MNIKTLIIHEMFSFYLVYAQLHLFLPVEKSLQNRTQVSGKY